MPFEFISAIVEDGMGTWLRADPVGRLLWAQPARKRDAAASASRRAEFMDAPLLLDLLSFLVPTCPSQIRLNRGHCLQPSLWLPVSPLKRHMRGAKVKGS